jgi:hypothetical protein
MKARAVATTAATTAIQPPAAAAAPLSFASTIQTTHTTR